MSTQLTKTLAEQLVANPAQAVCPQCGETGFYDNRNSPKKGKGPDFKCKNKDGCNQEEEGGYAFGVFGRDIKKLVPEYEAAGGAKRGGGAGAAVAVARPVATSKQLKTMFADCLSFAKRAAEHHFPLATPADIIAMATSLFAGHVSSVDFSKEPAKPSTEHEGAPPPAPPRPAPPRPAPPPRTNGTKPAPRPAMAAAGYGSPDELEGDDDDLPF